MDKLKALEYALAKYETAEYFDEWIGASGFNVLCAIIQTEETITKEWIDTLFSAESSAWK